MKCWRTPLSLKFAINTITRWDGVAVTFFVVTGGGSLSDTSVDTNANGLAQSTLTLGQNPGINTVMASVSGIQEQLTINAEGIRTPLAFWIISGDKQQGLVSEALAQPFLVEGARPVRRTVTGN